MKKYKTVEAYIEDAPSKTQSILKQFRKIIKSTAKELEENINYGIPYYKYKGRPLVGFAVFKNHFSFFTLNSSFIKANPKLFKNYKTSKGTVIFHFDKPLPISLIKRTIRERVLENKAKFKN